jgi:hypothetical protein
VIVEEPLDLYHITSTEIVREFPAIEFQKIIRELGIVLQDDGAINTPPNDSPQNGNMRKRATDFAGC